MKQHFECDDLHTVRNCRIEKCISEDIWMRLCGCCARPYLIFCIKVFRNGRASTKPEPELPCSRKTSCKFIQSCSQHKCARLYRMRTESIFCKEVRQNLATQCSRLAYDVQTESNLASCVRFPFVDFVTEWCERQVCEWASHQKWNEVTAGNHGWWSFTSQTACPPSESTDSIFRTVRQDRLALDSCHDFQFNDWFRTCSELRRRSPQQLPMPEWSQSDWWMIQQISIIFSEAASRSVKLTVWERNSRFHEQVPSYCLWRGVRARGFLLSSSFVFACGRCRNALFSDFTSHNW